MSDAERKENNRNRQEKNKWELAIDPDSGTIIHDIGGILVGTDGRPRVKIGDFILDPTDGSLAIKITP